MSGPNGFAAGEAFGRGEAPPKGSVWFTTLERIKACPAHKDSRMACICRYHTPVSCGSINWVMLLSNINKSIGCVVFRSIAILLY